MTASPAALNAAAKTSDVLNRAADLIEERGWASAEVDAAVAWGRQASDSPLCLEGGIMAALGVRDTLGLLDCPAYAAVADYLRNDNRWSPIDVNPDVRRLYRWNDVYNRTAAEVIEVLRAAAAIEAAREDAGLPLDVIAVTPVGAAV